MLGRFLKSNLAPGRYGGLMLGRFVKSNLAPRHQWPGWPAYTRSGNDKPALAVRAGRLAASNLGAWIQSLNVFNVISMKTDTLGPRQANGTLDGVSACSVGPSTDSHQYVPRDIQGPLRWHRI